MASLSAYYPQPVVAGTTAGTYAEGNDSRIVGAAQKASNLSDLASASIARTNLGLGNSAVADIGAGSGNVAAGDHNHGNITNAGAIGSVSGLPIRTGTAGVVEAGAFGTSAGQFAEGNHIHDDRYYTETETDTLLSGKAPTNLVGSPVEYVIACSDETTALTAGLAKVTFRAPVAFTLTAVSASVNVAPTGSPLIVDINNGANSVLSTKLSIDETEKTSVTAATAAVIDATYRDFTQDAEITIDIDQVGSTVAGAGLKVILRGIRI